MNQQACKLFTILITAASLCSEPCRSQVRPVYPAEFVEPEAGTIVHPGDVVTFRVSVPPELRLLNGMVLVSSFLGISSQNRVAPPFDFTVTIPSEDTTTRQIIGPQKVAAFGTASGREGYDLAVTTIDIEESVMPTRLIAYGQAATGGDTTPFHLDMSTTDPSENIAIDAFFPAGGKFDVTKSTYLRIQSSGPRVARYDRVNEAVTAVSAGTTSIAVTYSMGKESLRILIPVTVAIPKWGIVPDPPSLDFGDQPVRTASLPSQVTLANRSEADITISKIDLPGDFEESDDCTLVPLRPGRTCNIRVTFRPHAQGQMDGVRINIFTNNGTRSVPLFGNGTREQ